MATISSPGIGSGLDVNAIVTQLVALERRPIGLLQQQATKVEAKLSSFGLMQSYVSNLRSAVSTLAQPPSWRATAATSSDPAAVSVTSGNAAINGSYSIAVTQLAQAHSLASQAHENAAATIGSGTLRIELGSWNQDLTGFTPKTGATAVDIVIGAEDNTLEGIRARINDADAGVTASIVTDATGARLVLRASDTGAENALRITVTDDDGNNADASGLSALAFDPPSQTGQLAQTMAASNALATINGLGITSASNRLENVVEGLTMTLHRVTDGSVEIGVGIDDAAIRKGVQDFISAYNDLNKFLADQTRYDEASKTAGKLQGDSAAVGLRNQLRNMLQQQTGASSMFASLSEVGIEAQRDGSLKLNTSRFDNALGNLNELARLFHNAEEGSEGLAVRLRTFTTALTDTNGLLTTRTEGLRTTLQRNKDQQERLETRVGLVEARLLRQYQALDGTLGNLSGLGNYVNQQMTLLNSFYTNGKR